MTDLIEKAKMYKNLQQELFSIPVVKEYLEGSTIPHFPYSADVMNITHLFDLPQTRRIAAVYLVDTTDGTITLVKEAGGIIVGPFGGGSQAVDRKKLEFLKSCGELPGNPLSIHLAPIVSKLSQLNYVEDSRKEKEIMYEKFAKIRSNREHYLLAFQGMQHMCETTMTVKAYRHVESDLMTVITLLERDEDYPRILGAVKKLHDNLTHVSRFTCTKFIEEASS